MNCVMDTMDLSNPKMMPTSKMSRCLFNLMNHMGCIETNQPTPELYKDKLNLKAQYELLSTKKTEQSRLRLRAFFYEHGKKAGRLLAHQ